MSDTESDEDLRRATLMPPESIAREDLIDDEEGDDDLDKPQSFRPIISAIRRQDRPLQPKHPVTGAQGDIRPIAAGLLGLNRRQMENERLARNALRERGEDTSVGKRKASTSPEPPHDRVRRQNLEDMPKSSYTTTTRAWPRGSEAPEIGASQSPKPTILPSDSGPKTVDVTSTKSQQPPGLSGVQYPDGIVKKTWALGHARDGDDIKIEEVLQKSDLEVAVLSSFQVDADWVTSKLNVNTKVTWVLQARDEAQKRNWASDAPKNFRFCFPSMDGVINCMHSKLMLLAHKTHLRVVIPSANLTPYDWGETGCLENICFLIDLPRLPEKADIETLTPFGKDLLLFLRAIGLPEAQINSMTRFDFSKTAQFAFVHSIGGSHIDIQKVTTGLCSLGKGIRDLRLQTEEPLNIEFLASSIGNLNEHFLSSLYLAAQGSLFPKTQLRSKLHVWTPLWARCRTPREWSLSSKQNKVLIYEDVGDNGLTEYEWRVHRPAKEGGFNLDLQNRVADEVFSRCRIYFPLRETVQSSKGGMDGAGTICFQPKFWASTTFPRALMRDCKSKRKGLLMHSKMMFVRSESAKSRGDVDWVYVGSHNLSESAWGRLVRDNTTKKPKMNIRNWECGVIIPIPAQSRSTPTGAGLGTDPDLSVFDGRIPVPMIVPGEDYQNRTPWFFSVQ